MSRNNAGPPAAKYFAEASRATPTKSATTHVLEGSAGDRHEGNLLVSKVKKVLVNDRRD